MAPNNLLGWNCLYCGDDACDPLLHMAIGGGADIKLAGSVSLAEFHRGRSSAETLSSHGDEKARYNVGNSDPCTRPGGTCGTSDYWCLLAVLILGLAGFVFFRTWI